MAPQVELYSAGCRSISFATPSSVAIGRSRPRISRACCPCMLASKTDSAEDVEKAFVNDVRQLLCGRLPPSARGILLQDLLRRTPDAADVALRNRGFGDLADLGRQLVNDILPDIAQNGPRYASLAARRMTSAEGTSAFSRGVGVDILNVDVAQEIGNVFRKTPEGLFTPKYSVVRKEQGYEIRRYGNMVIARTDMDGKNSSGMKGSEGDNAAMMGDSFTTLAGYLFGENESGKPMKMTTPVILDKKPTDEDTMSFIIGEYSEAENVPKPSGKVKGKVVVEKTGEGTYACIEFSGFATIGEIARQKEKLLNLLAQDNIMVDIDDGFKCAIYNGPTTLPFRRRNELLISVKDINEGNDDAFVDKQ